MGSCREVASPPAAEDERFGSRRCGKARVLTSLAEGRRVERLSKSGGFLVPIGDLAFQISDVLGDGGFDLDGFALAGRARSAIIAK